MGLVIGILLCGIAAYSLITLVSVGGDMPTSTTVIVVVTQLLFLAVGGFLIRSYFTTRKR